MKNSFEAQLKSNLPPKPKAKKWIYVPYDQLTDSLGSLKQDTECSIGILMVESHRNLSRRPYHKQKIALLIANMRNFALEQARLGRFVEYVVSDKEISDVVKTFAKKHPGLTMMEPTEYELRNELNGVVDYLPHEGWFSSLSEFDKVFKSSSSWRMDKFYRHLRQRTGILMESGKPIGGKYSYDADNRKPWNGEPEAPDLPEFQSNPIKDEVCKLVEEKFKEHPGELNSLTLPSTLEDAEILWSWAKENCMVYFGKYEDAMSTKSSGIFHSRISSLLNIHRLLPERIVNDVLELDIPLNSKEGFVRQVIGWREFVRLIHLKTEGFRVVNGESKEVADSPGDGGFKTWSGTKFKGCVSSNGKKNFDGGATPSHFGADENLPACYWGKKSGLNCLDNVVGDVWTEAYSHHITRLMILSNLSTLLEISPRQLTDWFWIAYTDAYDWVVEPNVIGMGTHAAGELMTTKPYIAGANYINKMSDYCKGCQFDPKKNCPITSLYWAFLERHKEKLKKNIRISMPINSLSKRSVEKKDVDKKVFEWVSKKLKYGEKLSIGDLPS